MFTEILLGGDIEKTKSVYKTRLALDLQNALDMAVQGDLSKITKFANRIRTGGKSGKCKYLAETYPNITDDYIFVLPRKQIVRS